MLKTVAIVNRLCYGFPKIPNLNFRHLMQFTHFRHWSPEEIKEVKDCRESQSPWDIKPRGLYFSPNNDWIDWCEGAGVYPNNYRHQYRVNKVDEDSILQLNPQNVKQFYEQYESQDIQTMALEEDTWEPHENVKVFLNETRFGKHKIESIPRMDWNKVKSQYKGLYVPRSLIRTTCMSTDRYYCVWTAFDVETLVIWDKTAVQISKAQ
jgi:hypothetical protein